MPYELDFLESYDRDRVAVELRRIADFLGQSSLTSTDIHKHGRISPWASSTGGLDLEGRSDRSRADSRTTLDKQRAAKNAGRRVGENTGG